MVFGSNASLNPSPIKLSEKRVSEKAIEGNSNNHQYSSIETAPSLINIPQELIGACTPKPKKLKKASNNIIWGTVRVAYTITGPIALGIM